MKFLLITIILSTLFVASAFACSCMPKELEEHYEAADFIFSGHITRFMGVDSYTHVYDVEPTQVWKGSIPDEARVFSAKSSASCGFPFEKGDYYLIYASQGEKGMHVSLCSPTKLLKESAQDISFLSTMKMEEVPVDEPVMEDEVVGEDSEEVSSSDGPLTRLFNSIGSFFRGLFGG